MNDTGSPPTLAELEDPDNNNYGPRYLRYEDVAYTQQDDGDYVNSQIQTDIANSITPLVTLTARGAKQTVGNGGVMQSDALLVSLIGLLDKYTTSDFL